MAVKYLDFVGGSDANNGSSWALAKKTVNGAMSVAAAGDDIHVAKSPDPSALAGQADWTDGSTAVSTTNDQTGTVAAQDFVSKDSTGADGWHEVSAVSATTITLVNTYRGTSGSGTTTYKLGTTDFAGANNTSWQTTQKAGSGASPISIRGGYDTVSDTRTGYTMCRNTTASRYGWVVTYNHAFIDTYHFGMLRAQGTNFGTASARWRWYYCHWVNNGSQNVYMIYGNDAIEFYNCVLVQNGSTQQCSSTNNTYWNACRFICTTGPGGVNGSLGDVFNVYEDCVAIGNGAQGYKSGPPLKCYGCYARGFADNFWCYYPLLYVFDCTSTGATSSDIRAQNTNGDGPWVVNTVASNYQPNTRTVTNYNTFTWRCESEGQDPNVNQRFDYRGTVRSNLANARGGTGLCTELVPLRQADYTGGYQDQETIEESWPIPIGATDTRNVNVYLAKSSGFNGLRVRVGLRRNGRWIAGQYQDIAATISTSYGYYSFTFVGVRTETIELCVQVGGNAGSVYVDDISWT